MANRNRVLRSGASVLVVIAALTVGHYRAVAGGATGKATEMTQVLNNLELGMMTVQDAARNLTLAKQLYYDTLQQMPMDSDQSAFQETLNSYNNINNTLGAVNQLYGSVSTVKDNTQWRMNQFSASGLDWNGYVQREKDRAAFEQGRTTMLTDYEIQSLDSMKRNYEVVQRHQTTIQNTEGTHGAMTAMNGQMNTLLSMTNQGMEQAAVHYQAQTQKDAMAEADRQRRYNEGIDALNEQDRIRDKTSEFSKSLQGGKWADPFANK